MVNIKLNIKLTLILIFDDATLIDSFYDSCMFCTRIVQNRLAQVLILLA